MSDTPETDGDFESPVAFAIERISLPILRARAEKPGKGIDLSPLSAELEILWGEVAEAYWLACDDIEARHGLDRVPHKRTKGNGQHDYGADAGAGLEDWDEHWRHFYYRGKGRPPHNNSKPLGPPPLALQPVYLAIERWWRVHVGPYNPTFGREYDGAPFALEYCNAPARLLVIFAQHLDYRFTLANCANLRDTIRK